MIPAPVVGPPNALCPGPPGTYKVYGQPGAASGWCAMSGCQRIGVARDPRPRSELSVRHNAGYTWLCREHLTPAEIEWLRDGAPLEPTPSVMPGRRRKASR